MNELFTLICVGTFCIIVSVIVLVCLWLLVGGIYNSYLSYKEAKQFKIDQRTYEIFKSIVDERIRHNIPKIDHEIQQYWNRVRH